MKIIGIDDPLQMTPEDIQFEKDFLTRFEQNIQIAKTNNVNLMTLDEHPQLDTKNVNKSTNDKLSVINLFGGPGTGKSTTMAMTFGTLKRKGINCEMAPEWIKWSAWEGRSAVFQSQGYILEKQNWMLHRLRGKVEVAISDSPLILCAAYAEIFNLGVYGSINWKHHCLSIFNTYDNFNVYIKRNKPYNPNGRNQSQEQAIEVDKVVFRLLNELEIPFHVLDDNDNIQNEIIELYEKEKGVIKKYNE